MGPRVSVSHDGMHGFFWVLAWVPRRVVCSSDWQVVAKQASCVCLLREILITVFTKGDKVRGRVNEADSSIQGLKVRGMGKARV